MFEGDGVSSGFLVHQPEPSNAPMGQCSVGTANVTRTQGWTPLVFRTSSVGRGDPGQG